MGHGGIFSKGPQIYTSNPSKMIAMVAIEGQDLENAHNVMMCHGELA